MYEIWSNNLHNALVKNNRGELVYSNILSDASNKTHNFVRNYTFIPRTEVLYQYFKQIFVIVDMEERLLM
jgi:hypothetical protein